MMSRHKNGHEKRDLRPVNSRVARHVEILEDQDLNRIEKDVRSRR